MGLLPLRIDLTYGPVPSRRLGRSLGVNLFPAGHKVCSFDCIYCQYGRTPERTLCAARTDVAAPPDVLDAVEARLLADPTIEFVTFSGVGEPTLHPDFSLLVDELRHLVSRLGHRAKLALLSNSSKIGDPSVREALTRIDAPIMKLDAGDADTLARINVPAAGVKLDAIVEGLASLESVVVQTLFVDGAISNARGSALEAWLAAVEMVRPRAVQIYSTDRTAPDASVRRVGPETLQGIADTLRRRRISATAYWR